MAESSDGAILAFAILIKPYLVWLLLKEGNPSKEISELVSWNISNNIKINYAYYTYTKHKIYIYNINYIYTQRVKPGHIL